jgi:hypothetical protein
MNVELVAQMFKNYQSNVLFHLEGQWPSPDYHNGKIDALQRRKTCENRCDALNDVTCLSVMFKATGYTL